MYKDVLKIISSSLLGFIFFVFPVNYQGSTTVCFDVMVQLIKTFNPTVTAYYTLILFALGVLFPIFSKHEKGSRFRIIVRLLGFLLAVGYFLGIGPEIILDKKISVLMWNTLAFSIALIVPIGAIILNLFVNYGSLEFFGTLLSPLMRKLFLLPGRSSIDNLTSWLGSYSIGLYLTRQQYQEGYYTKKEAATIATCFSTVSIGFVGVVVSTLKISHLFLLVFSVYFITIYLLAIILVRVWPLSYFPDTYAKNISDEGIIKEKSGFKAAFRAAVEKAAKAPSLKTSVLLGAKDGFFLSISILSNILIIGTLSLLLVHHSSFFQLLSKPLIPLVKILHPVDAELISAAAVAGISEMFVPVLMVQSASVETKFFIAILSISQLIFFSSVGPMILTMFRELPVRFYHLIALFIIRTALLIPLITFICYLLNSLGMLQ
ncbi:MAG: hypothetical protein L7U87_05730 [Chlamydiales bacterium]|nr:hypothetical protein [Chlamydiales bacterium]